MMSLRPLALLFISACAGCNGLAQDRAPATPPGASGEVLLVVKVIEYNFDAMHSSSVVDGTMIHPDWFDSVTCVVDSPAAYAGQQLQIWGWNRQGGLLDQRFQKAGNVVRLHCNPSGRKAPPWGRGPTGFGQWEIRLEPQDAAPR